MNKFIAISLLVGTLWSDYGQWCSLLSAQESSIKFAPAKTIWNNRENQTVPMAEKSAHYDQAKEMVYRDAGGVYHAAIDKAPYHVQQKESGSTVVRYTDEESIIWTFEVKSDNCDGQKFTFWQHSKTPEYGFFRDGDHDYQVARYFYSGDMAMVQGQGFMYLIHWESGMVMDLNTGEIFE